MLAGPRRIPRTMAAAVSRATGTVTDRARFWGPLAEWRSRCRGPGSTPRRARPRNAIARRCGVTSGAPSRPIRDCRRLSGRHQHPSGASGARRGVWRCGQQKPAFAKAGDTVRRVWRKVKADWDAWNARSLVAEPIVRLILDGTVVRVRLDRKATSIVLLVVLGVRQDGQKVLLAIKNMGGETSQAWRAVLDDLVKRELRQPEFLIVDGGTGLEQALAALWSDVPTQRCTVHKHRNLLAHAPPRLHDEVSADYNDMIYAASPAEIEQRRRAFLRKWRLKCRAVADSLEEAGDRLFTFTRLPPSQWKSARTTNAIERLHEEFKRRIKTQTVLPSAETAAMLFWALLASGQITMRKVDGWQSLTQKLADKPIDLAA